MESQSDTRKRTLDDTTEESGLEYSNGNVNGEKKVKLEAKIEEKSANVEEEGSASNELEQDPGKEYLSKQQLEELEELEKLANLETAESAESLNGISNNPEQDETKPSLDEIDESTQNVDPLPIIPLRVENSVPITHKLPLTDQNTSHVVQLRTAPPPDLIVVPPTKPQLFYTPLKTGLVYDVRMRYHAKIFTSYFEYIDPHPEDPRRIYRIYKKLAEAGLIQDISLSGSEDIGPLMVKIPIREATAEEILEVHTESHLQYIQLTEIMTREQLLEETERGDSIYVNNDSFISAKLSCGGTIEACRAVVEGKVKNSLAIVRPPGHHAEPETPGGFCLFSNVAVAAKNILKLYPESVRRIVIVDWDIHHGNGTQKSFYSDPRVLYISLHRYENGRFYPGTKYGNSNQVGEGPGEGFNLNIPWRSQGMHDGDYIYAFTKVILPVITEFDPDLTIISSGFDAADGDIIGGCHVTPSGYGSMTHMLKGIAKGKLAVILEGGYNLDSISKSALGVAKVLVGEPPETTVLQQPHLETIEVIDEVVKIQSKYWKCLQYGMPKKSFDDIYDLSNENSAFKVTSISEPIRAHQYNELSTNHHFISIPIIANFTEGEKSTSFSTELPRNLEDIVVASPDIYNAESIVLTIHDPPDVWANLNPINGVIEGNSLVVLEHPLLQIMNKVQSEQKGKVGYIDINIPSFQLPIPAGASLFSIFKQDELSNPAGGSYNPTIFAQELLLYIWDNYLSYFGQLKKLVFVGFGDAYQAIVHLYGKRSLQEIRELVKGTVVFVNRSNLKSLVPVMDESMVDWYYQNSVIFTSCLNPCWQNSVGPVKNGSSAPNGYEVTIDEAKKPRRKFGRVLKSSVDGLYDVINEKFDEGVDFIMDSIEDYSGSS